jgi:hypothetical protein
MLNPSPKMSRPPVSGCRTLGLFMDRQSDHSATVLDQHGHPSRRWLFYAGPSMNPTLRASDILHIVPYEGRTIRLGDVIVFVPPAGGRPIVHRVVSNGAQGVRTRGDNNAHIDPHILEPGRIVGQVVSAHRGNKSRRIYGGIAGRAIGHLMNLRGLIDRKLPTVPHVRPQGLILFRAAGAWVFSRMHAKIVRFNARGESELQMLVGNHLIARLPARKERWVIRRRFRLFLDEGALPRADECCEQTLKSVE